MADFELRPLEIGDAQATYELIAANRKYLSEWFSWVIFTNSVSNREDYIRTVVGERANKESDDYAIIYDNKIVGAIGFDIKEKRTASIGYWLGEAYQGKGLASGSCKRIVKLLFEEYKVHRVEIRAAEDNHRSRKVAERIGMRFEGLLRDVSYRNGKYESEAVYSMLECEYKTMDK